MEAVQENTLKSGIYPTSFVHMVVKDLKTALVGCSEEATAVGIKDLLSESVLHLTVAKLCTVHTYIHARASTCHDSVSCDRTI